MTQYFMKLAINRVYKLYYWVIYLAGENEVEIKRVQRTDITDFNQINELYEHAFPLHEQRTYAGRVSILADPSFYLLHISDKEQFIGFIGCWSVGNYFYIEHIAIHAKLRGKGYGQKVLKNFCGQYQNIILEIDPLTTDIARQRLRFYQHCGFQINSCQHTHPNYRKEYEPHELILLTYPHKITESEYQYFDHILKTIIMAKEYL